VGVVIRKEEFEVLEEKEGPRTSGTLLCVFGKKEDGTYIDARRF
jgi:hypothetical protein